MFSLIYLCTSCSRRDDFPVLKGPYLGQTPPGMTPDIFAPGIISTEDHKEFGCTFSLDFKEFYFTRGGGEFPQCKIMVCYFKDGQWTKPEPAKFSGSHFDDEPHITFDDKRMFFGSRRPKPPNAKDDLRYGLWMIDRKKKEWGKQQYLGPGMYVASAKNGSIYYSLRSEEGDWGIVKSSLDDGRYTKPMLLNGSPNSAYYDAHPCISPDESFLIFDSKRPGAIGGEGDLDLYVCFKNDIGNWGKAVSLGSTVNTAEQNTVASLSPDGKYMFFANGEQDAWNIYWVDAKIIEKLKPDELK